MCFGVQVAASLEAEESERHSLTGQLQAVLRDLKRKERAKPDTQLDWFLQVREGGEAGS